MIYLWLSHCVVYSPRVTRYFPWRCDWQNWREDFGANYYLFPHQLKGIGAHRHGIKSTLGNSTMDLRMDLRRDVKWRDHVAQFYEKNRINERHKFATKEVKKLWFATFAPLRSCHILHQKCSNELRATSIHNKLLRLKTVNGKAQNWQSLSFAVRCTLVQ